MAAKQFDPFFYKDPPLFDATTCSIVDEAEAIIIETILVCNNVLAQVRPEDADFGNTIRPFAENENARSERENHLRFYASTSPSQELRDASNTATNMLNSAETDLFSQRNLFVLVERVLDKARESSTPLVDDQSTYYLSKLHQRFLANGCGIVDDTLRSDFVAKKKRLNDLTRECRKNLADERTGLWLTHEELHGVNERLLSQLTQGDGEHRGKFWLPTKAPFSSPVMANAIHETTRKKVHYAIVNRVPQNIPLFREMTLLRDETARMLGWPNHFAFKTSQKMVKAPDMVYKLVSEVRAALTPVAEQFARELLELKHEEAEARRERTDNLRLFFWDRQYFSQRLYEKMQSNDTVVSEYFELNTTLQKLLNIYEQLFGVRLVPVDTSAPMFLAQKLVWHDDVRIFSAWDVDGEKPQFLAYAYLDLFPREGKRPHIGHYPLQRVSTCSTLTP